MSNVQLTPHETSDEQAADLGFGKGGVPWYLMLFYLGFLTFFVWYVLEYQLPEYLEQGPIGPGQANQTEQVGDVGK